MIYQPFKHIPPYRKGGYDLPPLPDKNKKDEKITLITLKRLQSKNIGL
nr:MAG TPA: hypothetical protein [Caudoviricetes sp.]